MPPKNKKTVEITEPEKPIGELDILGESIPSDDEIQAPVPTPKPKRPMTEKQLEALAKGREACHARTKLKDQIVFKEQTKKQKAIQLEEEKKALQMKVQKDIEKKLIATAVKLKKKQLLEEANLAKYVDDDEEEIPDEVIRKIIKKKTIPKPILQRHEPEPEPHYSPYYFL